MITRWRCRACGKHGQVDLPDTTEYTELRRQIRAKHAAASPLCDEAKKIVVSWPGGCAVSYPRNKHVNN